MAPGETSVSGRPLASASVHTMLTVVFIDEEIEVAEYRLQPLRRDERS